MTITARIEPISVMGSDEEPNKELLVKELEIKMQQMGYLVPYREELNWNRTIASLELGEAQTLQKLKKAAAKNDRVLLIYARLFKGTIFQHLILHPNQSGIYLPFRFDEPFVIQIEGRKIWIGSSVRLLEELSWLQISFDQGDHQESVKEYWQNLIEISRKSVNYMSPIIFEEAI
ncbi:hypothetical protein [Guptibacillus hwajinpoensis]|uniref:hypothetical protein n=1 Tax=Guptibacillus hwajinpoensis TaxID=208199 RepID=UPI001CFE1212|nr:hypothetical protein [Pseudalkalibacillus hwajinpoensis]WLR59856.1 hypothetical protein LC071_00090 [Pseudalkalibacillus hwajinpoensis]